MSEITCAISGLKFHTNYLTSLKLPANEGFPHPVFAAPLNYLERMYSHHCKGNLNATDSYLLFLALVHSSDSIYWEHPVTLNPNDDTTKALIENNIGQLLAVLEKTATIQHPSFKQPEFKVTFENSQLLQLPNWIKAWENNVRAFYAGRVNQHELDAFHEVEAKLTRLILSGDKPERYSHVIADWADRAANFPVEVADQWKIVIRSCFNTTKMFNTPLALIKEIKEYCEANIEVGSLHFHTLSKVLNEGINRHIDYLGGSSLALGYTILAPSSPERSCLPTLDANDTADTAQAIGTVALRALAESAPDIEPVAKDYPNNLAYIKARLAYRVKKAAVKTAMREQAAKAVAAQLAEAKAESKGESL